MKQKKYAVAIFSNHDGENKLFIISADTAVEAAQLALIEHCPVIHRNEDYTNWVSKMGNTIEDIEQGAVNADLSISNIIQL